MSRRWTRIVFYALAAQTLGLLIASVFWLPVWIFAWANFIPLCYLAMTVNPDYGQPVQPTWRPDTPEEAQERSDLTAALYEPQMQAMAGQPVQPVADCCTEVCDGCWLSEQVYQARFYQWLSDLHFDAITDTIDGDYESGP